MKFVLYHRLSKKKAQGNQYGIDSQELDIKYFLASQTDYEVVGSFAEFYSGKGDWKQRHELVKAVELCKSTGATLVVAKVDRLGRNTASVATLLEMIKVKIAIMPSAENMVINILAAVAEDEIKSISDRITKGLAVAKSQGKKIGAANENYSRTDYSRTRHNLHSKAFAEKLKESVIAYRQVGTPYNRIAQIFNEQGKRTIRGKLFDTKAVTRICDQFGI